MNPEPNFNRIARLYRWAEYLALGPFLQRTRTHFLPRLLDCRQALVLGDGDGRFLARLLRQNQSLHALAVDISASMLELLGQRCRAAGRLQTQRASALAIDPPAHTDLIVTHFFLDCLTQPEVDALTRRLATVVEPGALWLLSDFRVPATGLVRPFAAAYIRALYFAFRVLTGLRVTQLPDPQTALSRAGFHLVAERHLLAGILYTQLWQLSTENS